MKKSINKGLRETPKSMPATEAYHEGWDRIFGRKNDFHPLDQRIEEARAIHKNKNRKEQG